MKILFGLIGLWSDTPSKRGFFASPFEYDEKLESFLRSMIGGIPEKNASCIDTMYLVVSLSELKYEFV